MLIPQNTAYFFSILLFILHQNGRGANWQGPFLQKLQLLRRVDLYSRNPESSNTLASKLNDRITEIQEKYKEPSEIQQRQQQQNFKRGDRDSYTRNKGKKYGRDRDGERDGDRDFKFKKNKFKKRFHKSNKK